MNIKEINKYFLNHYYKKDCKVYYDVIDDIIYLSDSYSIFILNNSDCMLDIDKFKLTKLNHFFNGLENYQDAIITNNIIKDGNINMIKIESDDKYCYINMRYLKLFKDCKVKINSETSPVLFYECDKLVGLVLPIKVY